MTYREFLTQEGGIPSRVDFTTSRNLTEVLETINPQELAHTLISARRVGKIYVRKDIVDLNPDQIAREFHLLGKRVSNETIIRNFGQIDFLVEALNPKINYHTDTTYHRFNGKYSREDIKLLAENEVRSVISRRLSPNRLLMSDKTGWGGEMVKLVGFNLAKLPIMLVKSEALLVNLDEKRDGYNRLSPEDILIKKEKAEEIYETILRMPSLLKETAIKMMENRSFDSPNLNEPLREKMREFLIAQIPELGETFRPAGKIRKRVNTVGMIDENGFPIFDNIPLDKVFGYITLLNPLQQKIIFYYVGYLDTQLPQREFAKKHKLPGINTVGETLVSSRRDLLNLVENGSGTPLSRKGSLVPYIEKANLFRRREYADGRSFPETFVARQSILSSFEKNPNPSFFEENLKRLYYRSSPRSCQIAMFVIQGLQNKDIATKMSITESCVKSVICDISKKLRANLKDRAL